jgi:hypothetical protein
VRAHVHGRRGRIELVAEPAREWRRLRSRMEGLVMIRLAIVFSLVALASLSFGSPVLAAPPSNDDISSPTVVGPLPYIDGPYDTTEATTGATDPDECFGSPDSSTVWYSFTPTTSGWYGADTFGSDYDTTLYVGTPSDSGGIDFITCNDDSGDGLQSAVRWEAVGDTTYLLMVGTCCGSGVVGQAGGGGILEFHVDVASPPPTIEVAVDPIGTFHTGGSATISGTVTCSGDVEFSFVDLQLTQSVGRFSVTGFGSAEDFVCDGTAQPWTVEVFASNGQFKGGRALAAATAVACDALGCAEDFEETRVRLRR